MGRTVAELLASIEMDELLDWMAYERLEPFGEERADVRSAIHTATLINVHRGQHSRPVTPSDVMPRFDEAYVPQKSAEQNIAELARMMGAKIA